MSTSPRPLNELDAELVELIRASPCLYDPKNIDFRYIHKKDMQWAKVAERLGMSTEDARKRWTFLRDRYSRELKLMHMYPRRQELGKSELFRRMDFLRGFVKRRRTRGQRQEPIQSAFNFETIEMQSQTGMQDIQDVEDSQDSTIYDRKYSYLSDQKPNIASSPAIVEIHGESQDCHDYEADSYDGGASANHGIPYTSPSSNAAFSAKPEGSAAISQSRVEKNRMPATNVTPTDTEDLFSKVIASHLKNLSRRYKIKAKVEMMQVLEKYIEIEENESMMS
uniref:MADF domain-containing protein n=1 Tax=Stomoxys calcitrans TaxID=35570 RepID=A0A1I8Q373_STOCA